MLNISTLRKGDFVRGLLSRRTYRVVAIKGIHVIVEYYEDDDYKFPTVRRLLLNSKVLEVV